MKSKSKLPFIALCAFVNASIQAQDSPSPKPVAPTAPPMRGLPLSAPLVPGDYFLVFTPGFEHYRVSFKKGADGKLIFNCPNAPKSPPTVFEHDGCYQFCIAYPRDKDGPDRVDGFRNLVFAGNGSKRSESDTVPEYRGKVAAMLAYPPEQGSAAIVEGDFILLPVKP